MMATVEAETLSYESDRKGGGGLGGVKFDIGTLVNVDSRTWPGINKLGGVGRVISFCVAASTVDVKYVLGGEEKGIDISFVQKHEFESDEVTGRGRGRSSSRRRRQLNTNTDTTSSAKEGGKLKTANKRPLKDASNKANKVKKGNSQDCKASVGVKRKAGDSNNDRAKKKEKKEVLVAPHISKKSNKKAKSKSNNEVTKVKGQRKAEIAPKLKVESLKQSQSKTMVKKAISKEKMAPTPVKKIESTSTKKKTQVAKKSNSSTPKNIHHSKNKISKIAKEQSKPKSSSRPVSSLSASSKVATPGVLKNVFKDMSTKAVDFAQEMVGRDDSSVQSSPGSESSLEIQMEEGREGEFDAIFSGIVRAKMLDSIELEILTTEMERRDKSFTTLEVKQHIERLEKSNKVMISSGVVYVV